jgi:hypothetical protein
VEAQFYLLICPHPRDKVTRMKILHTLALLLAVFCLLLCAGLSIGSWVAHSHEKNFLASAVHSNGTIVANIAKPSLGANDNLSVLYPQFSFQAADGQTHTITSNSGSSPASYSVGQHVDVLYAPGNPDSAQISGFMSSWLLSMVLAIFAVVLLFAAIFWIIIDRAVIVPRLREQKT